MKEKIGFINARNLIVIAAVVIALVVGIVVGQALFGADDERIVQVNASAVDRQATGPTGSTGAYELLVDDDGKSITDQEATDIATAAVVTAGGGQVSAIERSDDPGEAFEVEVIKDGVEIDVALDANLGRVPNQRFSD